MDTSAYTPKPYNYGPLSNYVITWYDGTTQDVKVHSIDFPPRTRDDWGRSYNTAQHIRFYASLDGHWTMILSAPEHNIKKVEFIDRDPEPEVEETPEPEVPFNNDPTDLTSADADDSEEGPDPRDNGEIPADEIKQLDSGVLSTLEKIANRDGLLDRRAIHHEAYGF